MKNRVSLLVRLDTCVHNNSLFSSFVGQTFSCQFICFSYFTHNSKWPSKCMEYTESWRWCLKSRQQNFFFFFSKSSVGEETDLAKIQPLFSFLTWKKNKERVIKTQRLFLKRELLAGLPIVYMDFQKEFFEPWENWDEMMGEHYWPFDLPKIRVAQVSRNNDMWLTDRRLQQQSLH